MNLRFFIMKFYINLNNFYFIIIQKSFYEKILEDIMYIKSNKR